MPWVWHPLGCPDLAALSGGRRRKPPSPAPPPSNNPLPQVREAYRRRGWAVRDTSLLEQCKDDKYMEELDAHRGEGCHMWGNLLVNKVAGNFHFAPGRSYQQNGMHVHDLSPFKDAIFDFSHTVHFLAFGQEYPVRGTRPWVGGVMCVTSGGEGPPDPGRRRWAWGCVRGRCTEHAVR